MNPNPNQVSSFDSHKKSSYNIIKLSYHTQQKIESGSGSEEKRSYPAKWSGSEHTFFFSSISIQRPVLPLVYGGLAGLVLLLQLSLLDPVCWCLGLATTRIGTPVQWTQVYCSQCWKTGSGSGYEFSEFRIRLKAKKKNQTTG